MAKIGERTSLEIMRERPAGLYLDAGELGEILLPRRELPLSYAVGNFLTVFLYNDSEDRPVATMKTPMVMPGQFAKLKCVAAGGVGAFLDWGLAKDLFVPFREQKAKMEPEKYYLVHCHVDEQTNRIIASARLSPHLDRTPADYKPGEQVQLIAFAKTQLGYKAIINGAHTGLLFANDVYQPLQPGESLQGYIAAIRPDGKIDLTLHAPGRAKVDDLETRILAELQARGGSWNLGDHSSADEINSELGVSKRTFKQAIGTLMKKRRITITPKGIRLAK